MNGGGARMGAFMPCVMTVSGRRMRRGGGMRVQRMRKRSRGGVVVELN